MDLSIVIPTYNEAENIVDLIPNLKKTMATISSDFEIIIIDGHSTDNTVNIARKYGVKLKLQEGKGYAAALHEGLREAAGEYVITMDADFSHDPNFIREMWLKRTEAEVIIASRFVQCGGFAEKSFRSFLSMILNKFSAYVLDLPLKDISSGFRMYHRNTIRDLDLKSKDYDILEEIIIRILCQGYKIIEVPLRYQQRKSGSSKARLVHFAWSYLRTLLRMWKLRNSVESVDYDERAYNSRIFLQKYWQRKRYRIIKKMLPPTGLVLDAGCGTSRVIQNLPDAIGLDIRLEKLRYLRCHHDKLVTGSVLQLPFKANSFDTVVSSQVLEHVEDGQALFKEVTRVLRNDGLFILGTPDYSTFCWRTVGALYELLPLSYGSEHVCKYTLDSLVEMLKNYGFRLLDYDYVLGGELILKAVKEDSGREE